MFPSCLAKEIIAGSSYNPTPEHHQQLLSTALDQLVKKQNKEEFFQAQLSFSPHLLSEPTEMQVQLQLSDDDEEEKKEDKGEEGEETPQLDEQSQLENDIKKHYSMKLTQTQRNKKRKLRVAHSERRRLLDERRRTLSLKRRSKKTKLALLKQKRDERKQMEQQQPDRLGKYPFQPKPVDFLFSDELPSSLRTLQGRGNVAVDIYQDFQKRNMIEPRVRVSKRERRYRLKPVQKRSVKEWDQQFNSLL